jgi:NAD-dependent dihydropyrimidine dehydrogenase PreA subunit
VSVTIDTSKCTGCGTCVSNCPVEGFELRDFDGRQVAYYIIEPDECIECGACEADCEGGAITLS